MSGKITRRQFLQGSGATIATVGLTATLGFDMTATAATAKGMRIRNVTPTPTVCPYCASGCGFLVYAERTAAGKYVKLLSVEGDPDNPINKGGACAKGAALFNMREIYDEKTGEQIVNPKRVQKPMYRAAGSEHWEEKDWDWMLDEIVKRVKESRDNSFIHKENDIIVNRTEKIGSMGGSGLDNEEAYLHSKLMRSLGVVYLETQARI